MTDETEEAVTAEAKQGRPSNQIETDLLNSAREFAQSALKARARHEEYVFLVHAATALEQLLKAYLAHLHPSLIAANDLDSLLYAAGRSELMAQPGTVRTITVTEAYRRVQRLVPKMARYKHDLDYLVDVRNGIVHLGTKKQVAGSDVLPPFVKAVALLIPEAHLTFFWGPEVYEIAMACLSKAFNEAKVRLAEKNVAAQMIYEARYGHLKRDDREAIIAKAVAVPRYERGESEAVQCPVCLSPARLIGRTVVNWEADYEHEHGGEYLIGAYPVLTFYVREFNCDICDLWLADDDELRISGMPSELELDADDYPDLIEADMEADYHSDYDYDD